MMRIPTIATITAGAGHVQAAAALQEAWLQARPKDTVERIDLLTFFSPLHKKIYSEGYVKLIAHAPEVWGMVFTKMDNPETPSANLARWRNAIGSNSSRKFARFVQKFAPDVVLCTHYLPVELLGGLPQKNGSALRLSRSALSPISKRTPCGWNPAWIFIAWRRKKPRRAWSRAAPTPARSRPPVFRSPQNFPVVLTRPLCANNTACATISPSFLSSAVVSAWDPSPKFWPRWIRSSAARFQTLVVAGRNEQLRCDLAAQDRRHPTHVLGFVTNMHELMAVSDLLVTKPGGLTTSEALAMGKPLFILNPIPGQEAANSDFSRIERGAAAKVNRVEDLPFRLGQLLGSKKARRNVRRGQNFGPPRRRHRHLPGRHRTARRARQTA